MVQNPVLKEDLGKLFDSICAADLDLQYEFTIYRSGDKLILTGDDGTFTVTPDKLLYAVNTAVMNGDYEENGWYSDTAINFSQLDNAVMDCLVQYAAFGEIVYSY